MCPSSAKARTALFGTQKKTNRNENSSSISKNHPKKGRDFRFVSFASKIPRKLQCPRSGRCTLHGNDSKVQLIEWNSWWQPGVGVARKYRNPFFWQVFSFVKIFSEGRRDAGIILKVMFDAKKRDSRNDANARAGDIAFPFMIPLFSLSFRVARWRPGGVTPAQLLN